MQIIRTVLDGVFPSFDSLNLNEPDLSIFPSSMFLKNKKIIPKSFKGYVDFVADPKRRRKLLQKSGPNPLLARKK